MLTDSQVLALTQVLVQNNQKATAIKYSCGMQGRGGCNTSRYKEHWYSYSWLSSLSGTDLCFRDILSSHSGICSGSCAYAVAAVVNDVMYVVEQLRNGAKKVYALPFGKCYSDHVDCAYDTWASAYVELVNLPTKE